MVHDKIGKRLASKVVPINFLQEFLDLRLWKMRKVI